MHRRPSARQDESLRLAHDPATGELVFVGGSGRVVGWEAEDVAADRLCPDLDGDRPLRDADRAQEKHHEVRELHRLARAAASPAERAFYRRHAHRALGQARHHHRHALAGSARPRSRAPRRHPARLARPAPRW